MTTEDLLEYRRRKLVTCPREGVLERRRHGASVVRADGGLVVTAVGRVVPYESLDPSLESNGSKCQVATSASRCCLGYRTPKEPL